MSTISFGSSGSIGAVVGATEIKDGSIAIKHDNEKVRLELLSPIALNEIAKVLTFGAKKYADHNWRKGFKWSRLLGASLRHILAFLGGEDKDPETRLSHLAHAGCCILFLLEHERTHQSLDDRYKGSTLEPIATPGNNAEKPISQLAQATCPHEKITRFYSSASEGFSVVRVLCADCGINLTSELDKRSKPAYF